MARRIHVRPALDRDQAAALGPLMAAFGVEQVTVTDVQPTSQPDQDPALTQAPAQASLLEEAS
jgi:aspartate-semialdehyde dehydrogenase